MAAKRTANGRFAKKEAAKAGALTKFSIADSFHRVEPEAFETDLTGSELEVFKLRMRKQYAGGHGLDPDYVTVH